MKLNQSGETRINALTFTFFSIEILPTDTVIQSSFAAFLASSAIAAHVRTANQIYRHSKTGRIAFCVSNVTILLMYTCRWHKKTRASVMAVSRVLPATSTCVV